MKKWLVWGLAAAMICVLAACGSSTSGGMADGTYKAEMDNAYVESAGYGWRDTLTVEYKDGKMVSAVFESYDASGNAKSADATYEMPVLPSEWIPKLAENILASGGNPDKVDIVAGATNSSNNAIAMLKAILEKGKANGPAVQVAGE